MKKKDKEREMCRELRRNGKSINYIAKETNVSKSSVSVWVRDVELTKQQRDALSKRSVKKRRVKSKPKKSALERSKHATSVWSNKCLKVRKASQEKGRVKLHNEDKEYAFGCSLFWGEGSKVRHAVIFTNSDPDMVLFFVNFLRKYFGVRDEKIVIKVQYYLNNGNGLDEIENYWVNLLGLSRSNFRKGIDKGKYYNKPKHIRHKYGICTIAVYDVDVTQQLFGSIKEITSDSSDKWLF